MKYLEKDTSHLMLDLTEYLFVIFFKLIFGFLRSCCNIFMIDNLIVRLFPSKNIKYISIQGFLYFNQSISQSIYHVDIQSIDQSNKQRTNQKIN